METRSKQPYLHLQFRPIRVESSSGDAVNTMAQSDKGIPSCYQIHIRDMNLASTHPATLTGWYDGAMAGLQIIGTWTSTFSPVPNWPNISTRQPLYTYRVLQLPALLTLSRLSTIKPQFAVCMEFQTSQNTNLRYDTKQALVHHSGTHIFNTGCGYPLPTS